MLYRVRAKIIEIQSDTTDTQISDLERTTLNKNANNMIEILDANISILNNNSKLNKKIKNLLEIIESKKQEISQKDNTIEDFKITKGQLEDTIKVLMIN